MQSDTILLLSETQHKECGPKPNSLWTSGHDSDWSLDYVSY